VIRETIREMDKVAIGRVVTSREHIIALEALDKGLMGTLLPYPYEVRPPTNISTRSRTSMSPRICRSGRHIVQQKSGRFERKVETSMRRR